MRQMMHRLIIMGITFYVKIKKRAQKNEGTIFVSPFYGSLLQNDQKLI